MAVPIKSNDNLKGIGIIMRSNKDFFNLNVDKNEKTTCKTIQFSHGEKMFCLILLKNQMEQ